MSIIPFLPVRQSLPRRAVWLSACAVSAFVLLVGHTAAAQSATGTITGRVLWGTCLRAIPLPAVSDARTSAQTGQGQPQTPDAQGSGQGQPQAPAQAGLPAGAVLVAVQSTAISARTDETGRFSLQGVPAGQYLTVAAGPVANAVAAVAERPNVLVNGGQSVDLGTLSLGATSGPIGIACRVVPPVLTPTGAADASGGDPSQPQRTPAATTSTPEEAPGP
jgi:hypothetical protein